MNAIALSLSEIYLNYKDWVRRNPQSASEVEAFVRWLSYFIADKCSYPAGVSGKEKQIMSLGERLVQSFGLLFCEYDRRKINKSVVLTELIYSASNLLVLFNDIIIRSGKQEVTFYSDKIKIWLTILEYSEVFIETSAKSLLGGKGKWVVIVCVQLLKCVARLILLLHYEEKIVSCPPVLPFKRNQEKGIEGCRNTDGIQKLSEIAFSLKRSGRVVRKVDSAPPINNRLWKPPAASSYNHNNNNLGEEPDKAVLQQHLIGEVLYIIKPVVSLAFMMKYGSHTWKPWTVSAAMDLMSLYLLLLKPKIQMSSKFSHKQKLELSRRRLALLLYLMRSPFYEKHSKDRISAFLNSLTQNVPLAKLICSPLQQFLPHWQETYFYLWSS